MNESKIKSVLILKKLVFDKIEFHRQGMKNDNEIKFQMKVAIKQRKTDETYCVSLVLEGEKEKEYSLVIGLDGYFEFDKLEYLTEDQKEYGCNYDAIYKKSVVFTDGTA